MKKKVNGKWHLYSKDGEKHLGGPYDSEKQVNERERQVIAAKEAKSKVKKLYG